MVNIDELTYAGNLQNLAEVIGSPSYIFLHADIGDTETVARALDTHAPHAVLNFAAESHVDRSIHDVDNSIQTNVVGTLQLLKTICAYGGQGAGRHVARVLRKKHLPWFLTFFEVNVA